MFQDMDGNEIIKGMRVAAAENLCGIGIKIETVGFTEKRVKVGLGDPKPQGKIGHRLVKVFDQKGTL